MVKHAGQPVKIYLRGRIYHFTISTVINRQRIFVRESTHTEDKQQAERYALKRLNQIVEQAPARSTWVRFMPNPMPTIAAPSSGAVSFEVIVSNGFPHATEKMTPQMTATPGA